MAEQVSIPEEPFSAETRSAPAKPPPEHTRQHHVLVWFVGLLVILALVALPTLLRTKTAPRRAPLVTISTTNAVQGNIDVVDPGLGTVTPVYTAMISPRVDGQLMSVNYTEGQLVKTNDLLAEIDPAPFQALLTQAEGQLARDKAQLEGATIDLGRYQDAYTKKAIPKQQVDDELALVHQDEGTVKFDEGQVENARVQLNYCSIRAPIAGRVGLRLIDPGNVVHAANTNALVEITELQPITIIFSLNEDFLPAILRQAQAGHKMTAEAWDHDLKEKLATGTFLTADAAIDTVTATIRIKALFDNADMALFPNQFVNVKLIVDTLTNVTLIPTAAVQRNPQGPFVYVVTNQTVTVTNQTGVVTTNQAVVSMRPITVGISEGDNTAVEGLDPGTDIASDNFNKLGDGMKVNLRHPLGAGRMGGAPGGRKHREKKDASQPKDAAQDNP